MSRGIDRQVIFRDRRDRVHFLELLGATVERYRFRVHAYCLMENHHAIVPPPSADEVGARLKKLREYRWSSYRAYAGYA